MCSMLRTWSWTGDSPAKTIPVTVSPRMTGPGTSFGANGVHPATSSPTLSVGSSARRSVARRNRNRPDAGRETAATSSGAKSSCAGMIPASETAVKASAYAPSAAGLRRRMAKSPTRKVASDASAVSTTPAESVRCFSLLTRRLPPSAPSVRRAGTSRGHRLRDWGGELCCTRRARAAGLNASGRQQRLDRPPLVHRAVALGNLLQWQREVEHLARVDLAALHEVDQLRQIAANRRRSAVQVRVGVKQLRAVELHTVRDADVADVAAGARGADRLPHRLLRSDTFEHRVGADVVRQLLDARRALVATLGDDVGCAVLAREPLPRLVAAHRDDPLGAHALRREHGEQADRAVADDDDRCASLHVRGVGREPAGAEDVADGEHARDHVGRRDVLRRHQRAVGERNAQQRSLRADDWRLLLAGRLVAVRAVRTRVVAGEEGSDDELALPNGPDRAADLLDDAAVLVAHRRRLLHHVGAAIRPQIGPADAARRETDDRIRRGDDGRVGTVLDAHVARTIENRCLHHRSPEYCSSVTCSSHSTILPSSASWRAMCVIAVFGEAPCQCLTFGGNHTTSPGRISSMDPPSSCTRPRPESTMRVCPSGCVCHAVRAPGSKVTVAPATRAGAGAVKSGSMRTVPVNQSAGPLFEGCEPARVMVMEAFLVGGDKAVFAESLVRVVDWAAPGTAMASAARAATTGMVQCISVPSALASRRHEGRRTEHAAAAAEVSRYPPASKRAPPRGAPAGRVPRASQS